MKRTQKQIRQSVIDAGISPGLSVCWDTNLGWFRFGCVLEILEDGIVRVQAMNGKIDISFVCLVIRHDIDDPILADQQATYGTLAK